MNLIIHAFVFICLILLGVWALRLSRLVGVARSLIQASQNHPRKYCDWPLRFLNDYCAMMKIPFDSNLNLRNFPLQILDLKKLSEVFKDIDLRHVQVSQEVRCLSLGRKLHEKDKYEALLTSLLSFQVTIEDDAKNPKDRSHEC